MPDDLGSVYKYREWLYRLALRLCGGRADAEDLVQEVLMKYVSHFQKHPPPPEGDDRHMAWLGTTVRNAWRSKLRKARVRDAAAGDPTLEASTTPDPEEDVRPFRAIVDQELEKAFSCLTPNQWRVFELSQQGKSHAEIAKEVDIKVGTVAKRLFDARKALKKWLLQIIDERDEGGGDD